MNICFYTDTFFPWVGGAETVLDNLARELTGLGHHIVVLAPKARNTHDAQYPYEVVRYRKPFSKRIGLRLMVPRLVMLHRRHRFDIIHCHSSYPPAYVALAFRKLFDVPIVVRPHGSDVLPGGRIRSNPRVEKKLKRTLARVDAVIAQGAFLKATVEELGVDPAKVYVIHNGVNLKEFSQGKPFGHPRPYMLGLGNWIPRKGFDVLLRAFAMLRDDAPDLLLAGRGGEEEKLKTLARELGITQRVRFVGFIQGQPKVDLYRGAMFFVCPSRIEPFGNVILEAMASGLPVVATAVGGNTELIADGERGLLCESENPESLADALQRMLENPQLVSEFSLAATKFVAEYDWPVVAGHYLERYRQVIQRR